MGVPGFYRWLTQRYPMIRRKLSDPSRPIVNNFFIDANSIIHNACIVTGHSNVSITSDLMNEIFRYFDLLIQIVKPTDLIFIAFDGPTPLAKTITQRSRRYKSVHNVELEKVDHEAFDRSSISTGCRFMEEIHLELLKFFEKKHLTDLVWNKPDLIYSSCYVPGEGEHKIMEYIRYHRMDSNWNPDKVHCIYSIDADLVFLGLQAHEPNVLILREISASNYQKVSEPFEAIESFNNWSFNAFEYLYISLIREYFLIDFQINENQLEFLIDDFIAISFLIGNDFIPNFNDIEIRTGDFNVIVDLYREFINNKDNNFIVCEGKFNKKSLKEFLTLIVNNSSNKYLEEKHYTEDHYFTEKNLKYIQDKYSNLEIPIEDHIKNMCHSILDAFNWVLSYYSTGCISNIWQYNYLYSPPLEFVLNYIDEYESKFELGEIISPLLQQLIVLPPQSSDLLPKPLAELIMPNSILSKYSPVKFLLDRNGRIAEWQSIPIIPIINLNDFKNAFNEVISKLNENELILNRIEKSLLYTNNEIKEIDLINGNVFIAKKLTNNLPYGMPTLNSIPIEFETRVVPIKVFEFPSSKPSIVIKIPPLPPGFGIFSTFENIKQYFGQEILIGYPYYRPAILIGAINQEFQITKSIPKPIQLKDYEKRIISKKIYNILHKKGLETNAEIFLIVKPLIIASSDGLDLIFSENIKYVPSNICQLLNDFNFGIKNIIPKSKELTINTPIITLSLPFKNLTGKVESINDNNTANIIIYEKSPLTNINDIVSKDKQRWTNIKDISKTLNYPIKTINYVLSSIIISEYDHNIALTLALPYPIRPQKVLDGWAKIYNDELLFNSNIINIIKNYFTKTGKLLDLLKNCNEKNPKFSLKDLFGENEEIQQMKYQILKNWLIENSPSSKFSLFSSTLECISINTMNLLEELIEKSNKKIYKETIFKDIPIDTLLYPGKSRNNINLGKPLIGKRVLSINSSGLIPFGEYGLIVGFDIKKRIVQVIFDHQFECCTNLEGRLKKKCGMNVLLNDIIIL